jgi:hypothetical protein
MYGQETFLLKYKWYEIEWLWEMMPYQIRLSSLGNGRQHKTILANKTPPIKAVIRCSIWFLLLAASVLIEDYALRPLFKWLW